MYRIPIEYRSVTNVLHGYPKQHGYDIGWIANELWNRFGIKLGKSTLERYLNPNDDLKFPADLITPFCLICDGDFSVVSYIREYPDPEKLPVDTLSIGRLTKEAGEAVVALAESIKDGEISHHEKQTCIKELMDTKELASQLLATLIDNK